ncbi:MAG: hypothetical protein ABIR96_01985 [Bdellovibrionota bacterium]
MTTKTIAYTDPIRGGDAVTVFSHYVRSKGAANSIIILPPTGGENILDRFYARRLCQQGFNVALIKSWSYDNEILVDFSSHDNGYARVARSIQHVLAYLPGDVGILGTSVGAFYAASALATEPRLKAATLIVGGSPLARVLAYSDLPSLKKQRDERMKVYGIKTPEDYEAVLRDKIRLDVSNFLPLSEKKPVLMIVGLKDTTVPTDTQETLWQELGKPDRIDIDSTHPGAIVKAYLFHRRKIDRFFVRELNNESILRK